VVEEVEVALMIAVFALVAVVVRVDTENLRLNLYLLVLPIQ